MGRDYPGSPKIHSESKRQRLTWLLAISGLCLLFYILGAWQSSPFPKPLPSSTPTGKLECNPTDSSASTTNPTSTVTPTSTATPTPNLDFETHHTLSLNDTTPFSSNNLQPCNMNFSEYTPCQDPKRGRRYPREMLVYRERHCPGADELVRCLIPAPPKYKTPFKWPQSRDYAWYDNIPHKELSIEKAVQNWIQVEGDRFRFPGGGTMFPRGADAYIDDINELIPLTKGTIRTAIDTGCGMRLHTS